MNLKKEFLPFRESSFEKKMDTKISRSIYSHEYVHGFIGHLGAYQQVWFTIHYFESQEPGAKQAEHQIHTRSERS